MDKQDSLDQALIAVQKKLSHAVDLHVQYLRTVQSVKKATDAYNAKVETAGRAKAKREWHSYETLCDHADKLHEVVKRPVDIGEYVERIARIVVAGEL